MSGPKGIISKWCRNDMQDYVKAFGKHLRKVRLSKDLTQEEYSYMRRGNTNDKQLVIEILTEAFDDNKSVNYVVKQDGKRVERI